MLVVIESSAWPAGKMGRGKDALCAASVTFESQEN